MAKRSLAAAVGAATAAPTTTAPVPVSAPAPAPMPAKAAGGNNRHTTGPRAGKRQLTVHVDATAFEQFRILGVKVNRSNQSLLSEAINDLFVKNGMPRLVSE